MDDEASYEQLRLKFRREAQQAIHEAEKRTRDECAAEFHGKLKSADDEARKWKAIAQSLSTTPAHFPEGEVQHSLLVRYAMEQVYRDVKSEFGSDKDKDVELTASDAIHRMKNVLIVSTNTLMHKLPRMTVLLENVSVAPPPISKSAPMLRSHAPAAQLHPVLHVSIAVPTEVAGGSLFGKSHASYGIEVSLVAADGTEQFQQKRRFSEFLALMESLTKEVKHGILPALPPKDLDSTSPKVTEPRRRYLTLWLRYLLHHLSYRHLSVMQNFLLGNAVSTQWPTPVVSKSFSEYTVRTVPVACRFAKRGLMEDEYEQDIDKSSIDSEEVGGQYNEAIRFRCKREYLTVKREFEHLVPAIKVAKDACKKMIVCLHDYAKALHHITADVTSLSRVEDTEAEKQVYHVVSSAGGQAEHCVKSTLHAMNVSVLEPLQFLEVEGMASAKHIIDDVKSIGYKDTTGVLAHRELVQQWAHYRNTRHGLLIEYMHRSACAAAAEHREMHKLWDDARQALMDIDPPSELGVSNGWKTLLVREIQDYRKLTSELKSAHAEGRSVHNGLFPTATASCDGSVPPLNHATSTRPTIPAGTRSLPSKTERNRNSSLEDITDAIRPQSSRNDSADRQPVPAPKKSWRERLWPRKSKQEKKPPAANPTPSAPPPAADEPEDPNIRPCSEEDTPMNRAYRERLQAAAAAAEDRDSDIHADGGDWDGVDEFDKTTQRTRRPYGGHAARRTKARAPPEEAPVYVPAEKPAPVTQPPKHVPSVPATDTGYLHVSPAKTHKATSESTPQPQQQHSIPTPSKTRQRTASAEEAILPPRSNSTSVPQTHVAASNQGSVHPPDNNSDDILPDGWEEVISEDGQKYYYHKVTRVSRWDRPTKDLAAAVAARVEASQRQVEEAMMRRKQERETEQAIQQAREEVAEQFQVHVRSMIDKWKRSRTVRDAEKGMPELITTLPDIMGFYIFPEHIANLALTSASSPSEVKKAYLKTVKVIHPDKLPGTLDMEQRMLIEEVYIYISQRYDVYRKAHGV